jgi:hypothetical protein
MMKAGITLRAYLMCKDTRKSAMKNNPGKKEMKSYKKRKRKKHWPSGETSRIYICQGKRQARHKQIFIPEYR